MAQKEIKYKMIKRLVEQTSASRFVFSRMIIAFVFALLLGGNAKEARLRLNQNDK